MRSILDPYIHKIYDWQRSGKTYKEMAFLLNKEFGIQIKPNSILNFVKRRSKEPRETYKIHPAYLDNSLIVHNHEPKNKRFPGKYNSRLNPYIKDIYDWQKSGKTYKEMAVLLRNKYNIDIQPNSILGFVKRRSKPPKRKYEINPAYLQNIPETKDIPSISESKQNLLEKTTKKEEKKRQYADIDYKNITLEELKKIPDKMVNMGKLAEENPELFGEWAMLPANGKENVSDLFLRNLDPKIDWLRSKLKRGRITIKEAHQVLINFYKKFKVPYDFDKDIDIFGEDK